MGQFSFLSWTGLMKMRAGPRTTTVACCIGVKKKGKETASIWLSSHGTRSNKCCSCQNERTNMEERDKFFFRERERESA